MSDLYPPAGQRPDLRHLKVNRLAGHPMTSQPRPDAVAVEAPLEIRLHGRPAAVLMRTPKGPGEDRELVLGFLFCEGVIDQPGQVLALDPVQLDSKDSPNPAGNLRMGGEILDVRLDSPSRGRGVERFFYSTSSCGACGKRSIASLAVQGPVQTPEMKISPDLIARILDDARAHQDLFASTGGVHASALYNLDGRRLFLREDVGRHNALDKVIGACLDQSLLPLAGHLLAISGRVGYEIIQKAAAAGIPLIAAVGAPTSLAVDLANDFGITLIGFAKTGSMNVYSHPARLAGVALSE